MDISVFPSQYDIKYNEKTKEVEEFVRLQIVQNANKENEIKISRTKITIPQGYFMNLINSETANKYRDAGLLDLAKKIMKEDYNKLLSILNIFQVARYVLYAVRKPSN